MWLVLTNVVSRGDQQERFQLKTFPIPAEMYSCLNI